ncbi:hypothetical protein Droror1_Dr00016022 [Drosera rotundifolia]
MTRNNRVLRPRVENSEPQRPTVDLGDRFSNLPHDILEIILSKLPLRDAVSTSTLSYTWKYKWLFMSSLECDWTSIVDSRGDLPIVHALSRTIDNFLINHQGPGVERFALKIISNTIYSDICRWIELLIDKGVKEFIFEECNYIISCIPISLFGFEHLTMLRLTGCSLTVPSWFKKFNFITDLYLRKVSISKACIERLICSCSCLERLTLLRLYGLTTVKVHGPALKYLCIDAGYWVETVIEDTPHLATMDIARTPLDNRPEDSPFWVSLFRSLSCLQSLRKLRLSGLLLKRWATDIPLHEVVLENKNPVALCFDDVIMDDTKVLKLCHLLLCAFPRTERFYFSVHGAYGYRALLPFFTDAKKSTTLFNNLRTVTMRYTNPVGAGADFLNFVVARSPEIELITLIREGQNHHADRTVENILKKLSLSSPNVTIVFKTEGVTSTGLESWLTKFPPCA